MKCQFQLGASFFGRKSFHAVKPPLQLTILNLQSFAAGIEFCHFSFGIKKLLLRVVSLLLQFLKPVFKSLHMPFEGLDLPFLRALCTQRIEKLLFEVINLTAQNLNGLLHACKLAFEGVRWLRGVGVLVISSASAQAVDLILKALGLTRTLGLKLGDLAPCILQLRLETTAQFFVVATLIFERLQFTLEGCGLSFGCGKLYRCHAQILGFLRQNGLDFLFSLHPALKFGELGLGCKQFCFCDGCVLFCPLQCGQTRPQTTVGHLEPAPNRGGVWFLPNNPRGDTPTMSSCIVLLTCAARLLPRPWLPHFVAGAQVTTRTCAHCLAELAAGPPGG
eukprot:m.423042 g.423042  ORF g.423042 m.423042 type:complete len:334 (+) comp20206_c0_seq13:3114-4115(+)